MTIFTAYKKGLQHTFQSKKLWGLLYLINIGVALLAAIPFYNLLDSKVGHSMEMDKWLERFNYTIFSDFMNEYGDAVNVIFSQSKLLLLLFFVLYAFLTGGILVVFKKLSEGTDDFKSFWVESAYYFWRMLRLAIYFLLMHAAILFVFGLIFIAAIKGGQPEKLNSEILVFTTLKIILPIYFLLATIISLVHDYAKIQLVDKDPKWLFGLFGEAFGFVFQNFKKTFLLYILNILTFLVLFGIYWLVSNGIGTKSLSGVGFAFIIGQLFLIARIGMKLLNLGSATVLFKGASKNL